MRVTVLYCRHCLAGGEPPCEGEREREGTRVRLSMLSCSCKIEAGEVLKILETGVDAVEIVGCPVGACRMLPGVSRADRRIDYLRGLFGEAGLDAERLGVVRGDDFTEEKLIQLAIKRAELLVSKSCSESETMLSRSAVRR